MLALKIDDTISHYDEDDANKAMRRYWQAKQRGHEASLERVPDPPEGDSKDEDPDDDPEPTPPGGNVSDIAVARIERHERMLKDRGIALPPPVYAAGTKVVPLGESNFRTSRQSWEDCPSTVEGLQGVYEAVQAEAREDHVVSVRGLRMDDSGLLDFGMGAVGIEANGLRSLVSRNADLFPRAGEYLSVIDPDLRATNFNNRILLSSPDRRLKLRLRKGELGHQVFAVVSERYASFDADQIALVLSSALLDSGMRGEVVYDPATTNLVVNGLYHADQVVDLARGDVFKTGIQFKSNDAAGGSIRGRGIAWRNLCLNLIVIGTGATELLRRKHIGTVSEVLEDVEGAAQEASSLFQDFAQEWGVLRMTPAAEVFEGESIEEIMAELAMMRQLDIGVRRDVLVEQLLEGWQQERGESLADLVNSVTSVHLQQGIDQWRREKFEEAAGLLVPVLARRVAEA